MVSILLRVLFCPLAVSYDHVDIQLASHLVDELLLSGIQPSLRDEARLRQADVAHHGRPWPTCTLGIALNAYMLAWKAVVVLFDPKISRRLDVSRALSMPLQLDLAVLDEVLNVLQVLVFFAIVILVLAVFLQDHVWVHLLLSIIAKIGLVVQKMEVLLLALALKFIHVYIWHDGFLRRRRMLQPFLVLVPPLSRAVGSLARHCEYLAPLLSVPCLQHLDPLPLNLLYLLPHPQELDHLLGVDARRDKLRDGQLVNVLQPLLHLLFIIQGRLLARSLVILLLCLVPFVRLRER